MADALNRMLAELRILIYVAKGYSWTTVKNEAQLRYDDGSRHALLYCGDFDPSSLDIEHELRDTLAQYGVHPLIERITLTYEQTRELPQRQRSTSRTQTPALNALKNTILAARAMNSTSSALAASNPTF